MCGLLWGRCCTSRGGESSGNSRQKHLYCNAWVLENKRLALRYGRLGFVIQSLLQTACAYSWLQAGALGNSENRL
jgi:hypothetical protein